MVHVLLEPCTNIKVKLCSRYPKWTTCAEWSFKFGPFHGLGCPRQKAGDNEGTTQRQTHKPDTY